MEAPTAALMDEINKINWWHSIDLGNGSRPPAETTRSRNSRGSNFRRAYRTSRSSISTSGPLLLGRVRTAGRKRVVALDNPAGKVSIPARKHSNSNHNPRVDASDRLPDPEVHAVHVEREEVDLPGEAVLRDPVVDRLGVDPGVDDGRRAPERVGVSCVEGKCDSYVLRIAVDSGGRPTRD